MRADTWAVLASSFPRWDLTQQQMAVWSAILADIDEDLLFQAAMRIARENRPFPPSPGEFRSLAMEQGSGLKMTASEAWEEMYRNRHRGPKREAIWSSEAVQRAAAAVRWDDPEWLTEQLPTIRAQFERYYNALVDKQERTDEVREVKALVEGVSRALSGGGLKELYGSEHPDDDTP